MSAVRSKGAALDLPLNLYNGGFGPLEWVQKLLAEGTLYHLWYFPAVILGVFIAWGLSRLGQSAALTIAALLYLAGLGGDSYYGLTSGLPGPAAFYQAVFALFGYTRNGLFFAPLFLLLGAAGKRWSQAVSLTGMALALDALRPIRPSPTARAWKEIDLDALQHNAELLQSRLAPGCALMAVVKADGYGHGAAAAARHLQKGGVSAFAVACLSEGIALRRAGIRGLILILGYTPAEEAPLLRRWRLIQTVADEAHGTALNAAGIPLRVHLAIDTGMRRLGVPAEDTAALARLYGMKNLKIGGIFSHLCVSDDPEPPAKDYTQGQLARFYRTVDWLRENGYDPGGVHIQASGGILGLSPQPCTYARAGIALYGVGSEGAADSMEAGLRPVLSLRARVVCVRRLRAGEAAGYGLAFQAQRDTRLAVVSIGYADGLPRELAQSDGRVLLRGQSCPMVGRMCMDQLFVDVTDVPEIHIGDIVTLIGRDGGLTIRAEEVSRRCGTITNELLSRLGHRIG